jgi:hypothetical protein
MDTNEVNASNRRLHRRARLAVAVKEKYQDGIFLSQASDISAEGIFLATAAEEEPGQDPRVPGAKCWLEFNLPNSPVPIKARGRVIRQTQYDRYQLTAIQFAAIAPSHRRLIQEYVTAPMTPPAPTFLPPPM